MAKFILLRDENAELRHHIHSDTPPAPRLDIADLSATDLHEAARDPTVICFARSMPTRLIEPEPLDDIRPDEAVPGWGIAAIGADRCPYTGAGVRVAVLDTGVDADHPAFVGLHLFRKDFAGSGNDDANGHGTHVSGTIFGRDVDGLRIGVARGVTEALTAKVLRDDGRGTTEMLFQGMLWAAAHRARVIALALNFDFASFAHGLVMDEGFPELLATSVALEGYRMNLQLFEELIALFHAQAAFDGGVVVVAAGGNESRRTVSPNFEVSVSAPAAARGVCSVAALTQGDNGLQVAAFSNTLPKLSAPGGGIVSAAIGGSLRALNGTSMACAHAAGAAALWWEAQQTSGGPLTADAVGKQLRNSALKTGFDPASSPADWGCGAVQAPRN